MIKIKLVRFGRKKRPTFRIVAAEERSKVTGRIVESLGYYIPESKSPKIEVNHERLKYLISQGAQPTGSVRKLLNL